MPMKILEGIFDMSPSLNEARVCCQQKTTRSFEEDKDFFVSRTRTPEQNLILGIINRAVNDLLHPVHKETAYTFLLGEDFPLFCEFVDLNPEKFISTLKEHGLEKTVAILDLANRASIRRRVDK